MKRILVFLLVFAFALSVGIYAEDTFLNFEFSTNAQSVHEKGDVIECTVSYKDINEKGLSSVELYVEFSDGLEYNSDASAKGLAQEWALWTPSVEGRTLKIGVVDDSAVTPGVDDFEIHFSFTVTSDTFSREYISLSEYYIYDFDINAVENPKADIKASSFVVNLPEASVDNLGASLRINNTPALRFGVKCNTLPENADLGILVAKTESLDAELTHSTSGVTVLDADVKLSDGAYTTSAFEISSNSEKYTFRPFAGLKMEDGNTYFVYFAPLERSAEDVARAALERETDSEKRTLLEGFSSGT